MIMQTISHIFHDSFVIRNIQEFKAIISNVMHIHTIQTEVEYTCRHQEHRHLKIILKNIATLRLSSRSSTPKDYPQEHRHLKIILRTSTPQDYPKNIDISRLS